MERERPENAVESDISRGLRRHRVTCLAVWISAGSYTSPDLTPSFGLLTAGRTGDRVEEEREGTVCSSLSELSEHPSLQLRMLFGLLAC